MDRRESRVLQSSCPGTVGYDADQRLIRNNLTNTTPKAIAKLECYESAGDLIYSGFLW